MALNERRFVRVTVTLERADGGTETITLNEPMPGAPFIQFDWNREPVEDVEAGMQVGYRIRKPGPIVDITLKASGRPAED